MSILLSAINRSKQTQQTSGKTAGISLFMDHIKNHIWPYKAVAAVSLSVLLGGIAAWLLNTLLTQHALPAHKDVIVQAQKLADETANTIAAENTLTNDLGQQVSFQTEQMNSPNVRMAGKVSLPIPVPQPIQSSNTPTSNSPTATKDTNALILGDNNNLTAKQLAILHRETGQLVGKTSTPSTKPVAETDKQQDLVAAFQQALKEVEYQHSLEKNLSPAKLDPIPQAHKDSLPKFQQLSKKLQQQMPDFRILAHVYSSSPEDRWLNVNGQELQQGDSIGGKLEIVEIRPRDVVLKINNTEFTVPAI